MASTAMPRIKKKTLVQFDNITNRYYIQPNSKKVFIFDKRTKLETPSKTYLRILEDTLKKGHTAMYLLNTKALNTPSIISLLSQYNVDIPKYHRDVDKIRSFLKLYRKLHLRLLIIKRLMIIKAYSI